MLRTRSAVILGALAIGLVASRRPNEPIAMALSAEQPDHVKLFILKRFPVDVRDVPSFPKPLPVSFDMLPKFDARLIDDNIGYAVVDVPTVNAGSLAAALQPYARTVEARRDFDLLKFGSFAIDATVAEPPYPPEYTRAIALPSPARDAFVVQFSAPVHPVWIDAIKAAGATAVDYVPENGYIFLVGEDSLRKAVANMPVQLLRIHQPIHKITEAARAASSDFEDISVMLLKVPEADDALAWLATISVAEPQAYEDLGDRLILRRTVATSGLPQLAQFPAVTWIEPLPVVRPSGEREAHLAANDPSLAGIVGGHLAPINGGGTNYKTYLANNGLRPGYQSLTVGMLDTGWSAGDGSTLPDLLSDTSANLVTSVNYTNHSEPNNDCYGHGTMVAGVIAGNAGGPYSTSTTDTGGFYMGAGAAPGINVVSGRIFNYLVTPTPTPPAFDAKSYRDIYADLLTRNVRIVNNSFNDGVVTYDSYTAILDKIVRHAAAESDPNPDSASSVSIVFSAGNADDDPRNDSHVAAPGTGKNVISVGASENNNPATYPTPFPCTNGSCSQDGNQIWTSYPTPVPTPHVYSRNGPTAEDGRIKPDLVAPGTAIESAKTANTLACQYGPVGSEIDPPSNQHYWSRGTSFSAPVVTGVAALVSYWFQNRFAVNPEPALLKATLINFAYDMYAAIHPNPPIEGYAPDKYQGWGKVDLARAFKTDGRYAWANQEYVLTPNNTPTFQSAALAVKDSSRPVRITLVWTDAGGGSTAKRLVNDLDLAAYNPNTLFYCAGNNFDPTTGRSKVFYLNSPTYDRKNNVEQITFLASDLGSTFVIQVYGATIAGDALNVWNPTTNFRQDFALFVDNVIGH